MSKEMNKLKLNITIYSVVCGLFMSLIIAITFGGTRGLTYFVGSMIAIINFNLNIYVTTNSIESQRYRVVLFAFLRIFLAVGCTLFFIRKIDLVIFYLLGFVSHLIVMIYCVVRGKGSASSWE
ncbi:hypothetical protein [uncultured Clostridium sp.]|uniref:hypothetical protein n=1 Tax=uncultured Clostridium sp. TaxID=59620 RepID=UPI0025CE9D8C|nr:hypothetical protein [uncultured Clostridium sp.]